MSEYDISDDGSGEPYHDPLDGQPEGNEHYDLPPDGYASDEAFLRPAEESVPAEHPAQLIRAVCDDEVHAALDAASSRIDVGDFGRNYLYSDPILSAIEHEATERAAEVGDVEAVESHLGAVVIASSESDPATVDACMLGLRVGSDHAANVLDSLLEQENNIVAAYWEENGPMAPPPDAPLLSRVVEICGDRGIPPNQWIDDYGLGPKEKWQLSMKYYEQRTALDIDEGEKAMLQQQLDVKAAELLDGGFPPQFIFDSTRNMLEVVQDPALRERFADVLTMRWNVPISVPTFAKLMAISRQIVSDPVLATPERVEATERSIRQFSSTLKSYGMASDSLLAHMQLEWQADLAVHQGATPDELVSTIDAHIGQLLNDDIPDAATDIMTQMPTREDVSRWREAMLNERAVAYAQKGDFAGAKTVMNAFSDERYATTALMECLDLATEPEQAGTLFPDKMTLDLNPDMKVPVRFTKRRMANDLRGMAALAVDCAETMPDQGENVQRWYINKICNYIATSPAPYAIDTARTALFDLRESGVAYELVGELSQALIAVGDEQEPQLAYTHINRTATNPSQRLYDLWKLARHIEKNIN